ncbi:MAG: GNAT family N-acetyltransferase [Burkholderiaceae bacterium]|nr:GNAT family N-acetyltransferase [Burkholderiaceae bacterium]
MAEVICESRREYVAFAPMVHTPEEVRGWVTEVLIPGGGVTVATRGGTVVAVLAVSQSTAEGWIDQLYVKPGYTGQGLGAKLLQHAHTALRPPVRLYTFQANAGARRFYERHGYAPELFTDGSANEEGVPDVLYVWGGRETAA